MDLSTLTTEQRNPATAKIDQMDTLSMLNLINEEDKKAATAVEKVLPEIARAVDLITAKISDRGDWECWTRRNVRRRSEYRRILCKEL